jgi:hypothetical protein
VASTARTRPSARASRRRAATRSARTACQALADLVAALRRDALADGLVRAVEATGVILAAAAPPRPACRVIIGGPGRSAAKSSQAGHRRTARRVVALLGHDHPSWPQPPRRDPATPTSCPTG